MGHQELLGLLAPVGAHGGHEVAESYGWAVEPAPLAGLVVVGVVYLVATVAARRRGRPPARGRAVAFLAGLVVIALALFSPIDPFGEERSAAVHMVQHELLLMIAPLLLVVGLDQKILLPVTRLALRPVRFSAWRKLLATIGHPWFAVTVWAVVTLGWHLPAIYDLALRDPTVHIVEHLSLITVGFLFWAVLAGRFPSLHHITAAERVSTLGAVMALGGLVGALLIFSPVVLYHPYAAVTGWLGMPPLVDQRVGGGLMMAIDMPLLLAALLVTLGRAMARFGPATEGGAELRSGTHARSDPGARPGGSSPWPAPAAPGGNDRA